MVLLYAVKDRYYRMEIKVSSFFLYTHGLQLGCYCTAHDIKQR